ncbi:MAG: hypothetical protein IPN95_11735 [Bacteroidetes bacterium]|nr:hypothetical protein [Bacteroidota bacterium]MBL0016877.1 hypothetical protein [Bacteroidota bacterium]
MRDQNPVFSTSIELAGSKVYYRVEDQWINFNVSQIQLIGEFSAPPGVLAADYFFSFKLREAGGPIDVPAYTDGLFQVLAGLKKMLPGLGSPVLQMETDFNSNVLYPAHVAGQRLYNFRSEVSPVFDFPVLRNWAKKQVVVKHIRQEVLDLVY